MKEDSILYPFTSCISFEKLISAYSPDLQSEDPIVRLRAEKVFEIAERYPELVDGVKDPNTLKQYREPIDILLADAFAPLLTRNEIKTAGLPFENLIFKSSDRFKNILGEAGFQFIPDLRNMDPSDLYIMACSVILTFHFGRDVQFKRPLYYDIPDKNGIMKHYRVTYNADFMQIMPTERAKMLSDADIDQLLDGFDNFSLWLEMFPPGSWTAKGFVIANIFDVTLDNSISELKTGLLKPVSNDSFSMEWFQKIFQSIFGIKDIRVGYSAYDPASHSFHRLSTGVPSYLLSGYEEESCDDVLCAGAKEALLNRQNFFAISDIEAWEKRSELTTPYQRYHQQGFNSAILAPVKSEKGVLGVLELLSYRKKELNSVNANKLADVMPFIVTAVERNMNEQANLIEAVIQNECTSIHESVKWRFVQEAKHFLSEKNKGHSVSFREISFPEVYPLYGQIDIKDSSLARNKATQTDLIQQLQLLVRIFDQAYETARLPIFEEYSYRLHTQLEQISLDFDSTTEQSVMQLLHNDIHPALEQLDEIGPQLKEVLNAYFSALDPHLKMIYKSRKEFDQTVGLINKEMAKILDGAHKNAYALFPHYYERYKTDGVEHSLYIGASIAQNRKFSQVYLQNLRLWQLETMCYMENRFYSLKSELPIPLEVTSLVLVHSSPITIKFRMDEKHFDVEGSYNTRYEVLKKRIDKALIKDSDERAAQPGSICIVYSQKADEAEYKRYIRLLQAKGVLTDQVERFDLETLQGVSGLKALRVGIWYSQDNGKSLLSYDELIKTMSANLE